MGTEDSTAKGDDLEYLRQLVQGGDKHLDFCKEQFIYVAMVTLMATHTHGQEMIQMVLNIWRTGMKQKIAADLKRHTEFLEGSDMGDIFKGRVADSEEMTIKFNGAMKDFEMAVTGFFNSLRETMKDNADED